MTDRTPTIDFDHHSLHYKEHWQDLARQIHALDFPMAWSDQHDGFWVLASWEDAKRMLTDWENFSSDNDLNHEREGFRGVTIPQQSYPLMLSESDPPLSVARRRLEMPFFTPKGLRTWGPIAERFFHEALDACKDREEVDLVHDIVIPTTARTTLHIVGFEPDNWRDAALSAHRGTYVLRDDPNFPSKEMARTREMFLEYLAARRKEPKEDIISALAHGTVNGMPLTDSEGESMLSALVFGGFDTTTSAAVNALIWLARNPGQRESLVASQQAMSRGIDEFLRVFPPTAGVARNARRDIEIGGRNVRKGDRIMAWFAGTNRDPRKFKNPETVDLSRENASHHLSFSAGLHHCLGAPLARLELVAMLETFIRELPEYTIDESRCVSYPLIGTILGYSHVPTKLNRKVPA